MLTYKILLDYDDFKNRKFLENKYYSIRKPFSLERDTSKLLVRGSLIDVIAMLMEKNMYFGSTIPQEAQMLKSKYNAKLTEIGPGVDIKNHVVWGSINTNEITNNSNQIKITEYSFKDKPVKSREYLLPLKSKSEFLKHVSVIDEMVDNNLSIIRDYTNLQNGYARQEIYLVRNKVEEPFKYKEKTPIQEVADILFT